MLHTVRLSQVSNHMEVWMILLISLYKVHGSFSCQDEPTKTCEDKFAMAGDSVDFSCPIPGAGPISWFFRKTTDTNWTSFPFSFCKCSFCDYELCVLKRGILEIRDASITNKGFFECERNGAHHCFDLELYNCERGSNPLPRKPPKTVLVKETLVKIECGIDFCDHNSDISLYWYHKGVKITSNYSDTKWSCLSKTSTRIESKLVIDEIDDDDFLFPFVCTIQIGNVVSSYNTSLIRAGPVIEFILGQAVLCAIILLAVILVLIIAAFIMYLFPSVRFKVLTRCSFWSRIDILNSKAYEIDVFIMHGDDDMETCDNMRLALSKHGYIVKTMEDFNPGLDSTREIKAFIETCASVIVIYPLFHITDELDHQLSAVKENIKPYFITLLVHDKKLSYSKNDYKLKKFGFKHIVFDDKIDYDVIKWRIPKCRFAQKQKMYGATS